MAHLLGWGEGKKAEAEAFGRADAGYDGFLEIFEVRHDKDTIETHGPEALGIAGTKCPFSGFLVRFGRRTALYLERLSVFPFHQCQADSLYGETAGGRLAPQPTQSLFIVATSSARTGPALAIEFDSELT